MGPRQEVLKPLVLLCLLQPASKNHLFLKSVGILCWRAMQKPLVYSVFCMAPRQKLLKPLVLPCFLQLASSDQLFVLRFCDFGRGPMQKT